jgi:hypothetical protein
MDNHQMRVIEQLAQKLQLGQGQVMQLAYEITHREAATLYDLDRVEADRLIVYLDSLHLAPA